VPSGREIYREAPVACRASRGAQCSAQCGTRGLPQARVCEAPRLRRRTGPTVFPCTPVGHGCLQTRVLTRVAVCASSSSSPTAHVITTIRIFPQAGPPEHAISSKPGAKQRVAARLFRREAINPLHIIVTEGEIAEQTPPPAYKEQLSGSSEPCESFGSSEPCESFGSFGSSGTRVHDCASATTPCDA
jgi:hypothetical protein